MVQSLPPQQTQPYKFFGKQHSGSDNQNLVQIQTANPRPGNPYHVNYNVNVYKQIHAPNVPAPPSQMVLPGIDQRPTRTNESSYSSYRPNAGIGHIHDPAQDSEAKKIRRNMMRRTVDYNASIIQTIKVSFIFLLFSKIE